MSVTSLDSNTPLVMEMREKWKGEEEVLLKVTDVSVSEEDEEMNDVMFAL